MSYYAIFTTIGLQRLAEAQYTGVPLIFTEIAVGDGNGSPTTPDAAQTALVHEVYRDDVNSVEISPSAPDVVRVEGLIVASEGGWTIREAGLFNAAGELIAVASYPPTYKSIPADGVETQEYIRLLLQYAAVDAIALTVDPSIVTATQEDVDDATAGGLYLWENFT